MIRVASLAALAATMAVVAPASAQAQTVTSADQLKGPSLGATVYGPDEAEVGKITAFADDIAEVDTGNHKINLPASVFGKGPKGPLISVNKAQLDAMAAEAEAKTAAEAKAKAAAQLQAAMVVGATVRGSAGTEIATVKEIGPELVTLKTDKGEVRLPRTAFGADDKGLIIGLSAEEFDAAVAGS